MACDECDRLWKEYGDAMKKVGAIEGALRLAKLQENPVGIADRGFAWAGAEGHGSLSPDGSDKGSVSELRLRT